MIHWRDEYALDITEPLREAAEAEMRNATKDASSSDLQCIIDAADAGQIQGEWYIKQGCGCFYGWLWACTTGGDFGDWDGSDHIGDLKESLTGMERDLTPLEKYIRLVEIGDTPATNERLNWLVTTLQAIIEERGK